MQPNFTLQVREAFTEWEFCHFLSLMSAKFPDLHLTGNDRANYGPVSEER